VLKLGLAADLDSDTTITGCTSFRTGTMGPDGAAISVGAMIRLEADVAGGRFRATVRSKNGPVAQALKNAFKQQLAGKQ